MHPLGVIDSALTRPVRLLAGVAAAALAVTALGAAGAPALAGAAVRPAHVTSLNAVPKAVSVVSADDAWAVTGPGGIESASVAADWILHWNGTTWTKLGYPGRVSSGGGVGVALEAVDALSASDVWAVGTGVTKSADRLVAEHWNGTNWTETVLPGSDSAAFQESAVDADAASDVWAVAGQTIDHFNGTSWTQVSVPDLNRVNDVAAVSPSDVWIVGQGTQTGVGDVTRAVNWNGTSWSTVPTPNPTGTDPDGGDAQLLTVSAAGADDIWATGPYQVPSGGTQTIAMQWSGTSWTQVSLPTLDNVSYLTGLDTVSPSLAWAVGTLGDGGLLLKWNGTSWAQIPIKIPSGDQYTLNDVSSSSASNAWAVGSFFSGSKDAYSSMILHWNGTTWTRS
jgi:hypothetical protein